MALIVFVKCATAALVLIVAGAVRLAIPPDTAGVVILEHGR
jgi:hypothetical protein